MKMLRLLRLLQFKLLAKKTMSDKKQDREKMEIIRINRKKYENLQEYCERTGLNYNTMKQRASRGSKNYTKVRGGWYIQI